MIGKQPCFRLRAGLLFLRSAKLRRLVRAKMKSTSKPLLAFSVLKAQPHQLLLQGSRRHPGTVRTFVGSAVPAVAAEFASQLFTAPRYFPVPLAADQGCARRAFVEELRERNFDLATFRLSLFLEGHGAPRKPRAVRHRNGMLRARWGWLAEDHTPDIVTVWHTPARACDSRLFHHVLSSPVRFTPPGLRDYPPVFDPALESLKSLGWDLHTLEFDVARETVPGEA